jgi:NADPH-dependent curcumin reductase CurA
MAVATDVNRRIKLRSRPTGRIDDSVFELVEEPVPEPDEGEALVRNLFVSLDPTNRVWISDVPSYLPPVEIGAVMRSGGLGRVVASRSDQYAVGDLVGGLVGWQDYVVAGRGEAALQTLPSDLPVPHEMMLGVLGVTGYTAYFGMEIGQPKEGDTVVVSAGAGAVGSIAGQIAKIHGARAVGIVGSDEKCSLIVDELGFDAAVNRRDRDWREQLEKACPDGVDVDFENVGGEIMDQVFGMLNLRARVVLCGLISQYNEAERAAPGPTHFPVLLSKRVRLEGFIILDYWDRFPEATAQLAQWVSEGKLRHRDTVVEGLEKAPEAINMLFEGDNVGKLLVKVADDPLPA